MIRSFVRGTDFLTILGGVELLSQVEKIEVVAKPDYVEFILSGKLMNSEVINRAFSAASAEAEKAHG